MYCGLCTEACPYEAIQSGGTFRDAVYFFDDMYHDKHELTRLAHEHLRSNDYTYPNGMKAPQSVIDFIEAEARRPSAAAAAAQTGSCPSLRRRDDAWLSSPSTASRSRRRTARRSSRSSRDTASSSPTSATSTACRPTPAAAPASSRSRARAACSSPARAKVADGMIVRTDTAGGRPTRQAVLSIINANHSDRCLTCHRRVHCKPGDICLRDDTVTHRCLTCAKNYRCELQTTNEMLEMAALRAVAGRRALPTTSPSSPSADRANPFLEFDPQMCIICTRCVRACDEIRHTGAITLAGTRLADAHRLRRRRRDPRVELRLLRRLHRRLPDGDAAGEAEQVDRQDRGRG